MAEDGRYDNSHVVFAGLDLWGYILGVIFMGLYLGGYIYGVRFLGLDFWG